MTLRYYFCYFIYGLVFLQNSFLLIHNAKELKSANLGEFERDIYITMMVFEVRLYLFNLFFM